MYIYIQHFVAAPNTRSIYFKSSYSLALLKVVGTLHRAGVGFYRAAFDGYKSLSWEMIVVCGWSSPQFYDICFTCINIVWYIVYNMLPCFTMFYHILP